MMKKALVTLCYNRLSKHKRQIHARSLLGGGNQQGFYKGYLLSTGERYETAKIKKAGMATVPRRSYDFLSNQLNPLTFPI
jgi:hypothetical protein